MSKFVIGMNFFAAIFCSIVAIIMVIGKSYDFAITNGILALGNLYLGIHNVIKGQ